mmetsp:Transcript_28290/g.87967  ORF Transcript_28290/g.87967 Transcript_28290/m.87967 type:complete len:229 (-) Transcript_28290:48-734(-)
MFTERRFPFNVGFVAFQVDAVSLDFALNLGAHLEPTLLVTDDDLLVKHYPLDQEIMAGYIFQQGPAFWAAFSPELVRIFLNTLPFEIMKVKVQHACGSAGGDRMKSLYRTRRFYYSLLPLCRHGLGPEHPCCLIYGHQPDVFLSGHFHMAPFLRGSIYGPLDDRRALANFAEKQALRLLGADARQELFWSWKCEMIWHERMKEWQLEHPEEDFMQGRPRPLPEGFVGG